MTCSMSRRAWLELHSQLAHRLPCSTVRAFPLVHRQWSIRQNIQSRSIHTTDTKYNEGFSITFGSQIDHVLESRKQKRKKTSVKGKSEKTTSIADSLKQTDVDSNLSVTQIKDLPPTDQDVPSQDATIELSEDAYDTISMPKQMYALNNKEIQLTSKNSKRRNGDVGPQVYERVITQSRTKTNPDVTQIRERLPKIQDDPEPWPKKSMVDMGRKVPLPQPKFERWRIQKDALEKKFKGEVWSPRKKLSPDAVEGIRTLHEQDPERYSTPILSQQFKVSPEAIRRILRSKWRPSADKMEERRARWARRHDRIWDQQAALGLRPPRTRDREPDGPEAFEEEVYAKQMLRQL